MQGLFCPNAVAWGDVATWVSGVATAATVGVALWLAGREARRRKADKLADEGMSDFRASVLLLPAFEHFEAVTRVLPARILHLEARYNGNLRKASELLELEAVESLRSHVDLASALSRKLSTPVLGTFAWCLMLRQSLEDVYERKENVLDFPGD